jgi:hypothetical protein
LALIKIAVDKHSDPDSYPVRQLAAAIITQAIDDLELCVPEYPYRNRPQALDLSSAILFISELGGRFEGIVEGLGLDPEAVRQALSSRLAGAEIRLRNAVWVRSPRSGGAVWCGLSRAVGRPRKQLRPRR